MNSHLLQTLLMGVIVFGIAGCEADLQVKTSEAACDEATWKDCPSIRAESLPARNIPDVIRPGDEYLVEGYVYKVGSKVLIDGIEVDTFKSDSGELGINMPFDLATKRLDITVVRGSSVTNIKNVFSLKADDFPLITTAPSNICNTLKFYNQDGELVQGTKSCEINEPDLKAENIKAGITIGGVLGTSVAGSQVDCSSDGSIGCVATVAFPAAKAEGLAAKVAIGSRVAGIDGTWSVPTATLCTLDGEIGCQTSANYPALEVSGASAKIIAGQVLGGISGAYLPDFPSLSNVSSSDTVDGAPGTLLDCSGDGAVGCITTSGFRSADMTSVVASNIRRTITIAGILGTYSVAGPPVCTADGEVGCETNVTFKAANTGTFTNTDILIGTTIAGIAGAMSNQGSWDLTTAFPGAGYYSGVSNSPSASNILTGTTIAGIAGAMSNQGSWDLTTVFPMLHQLVTSSQGPPSPVSLVACPI